MGEKIKKIKRRKRRNVTGKDLNKKSGSVVVLKKKLSRVGS